MGPSGPTPTRVLHVFSTFATGGPQVRFAKLAARLGSQFEHRLVAMDGCYDCMPLVAGRAPVTALDAPPRQGLPAMLRWFRRLFAAEQPDLVMTYNWGAIECALATALPPRWRHLHLEDGFGPEEVAGQLGRRVLFRRLALCRSQKVIVPSHVLLRIARETWRLPEHRLALIPNGIDCAAFTGAPDATLVPGLQRTAETVVVGTVATLRPEKNIGRLIRVFAQAREQQPGLQLLIVGDGPSRAELEAEAAALNLGGVVHFAGHVAEPQRVLGLMDLFALSSNTEQMPISIIEAMAAGLPIAGLAVGDVALMVGGGNRELISPPGDEAGLARCLLQLAGDADLRARLGAENRVHVGQHYDEDQMVAAHAALMLPPATGPGAAA